MPLVRREFSTKRDFCEPRHLLTNSQTQNLTYNCIFLPCLVSFIFGILTSSWARFTVAGSWFSSNLDNRERTKKKFRTAYSFYICWTKTFCWTEFVAKYSKTARKLQTSFFFCQLILQYLLTWHYQYLASRLKQKGTVLPTCLLTSEWWETGCRTRTDKSDLI